MHDTVSGFLSAAQSDASVGEVINIGSNFEISIHDTALLIAEIMNKKIDFIEDPNRIRPEKSEVSRLWADNSRARDLVGWAPEYAGIEGLRRGLGETIEWFGDSANLRRYKATVYNL